MSLKMLFLEFKKQDSLAVSIRRADVEKGFVWTAVEHESVDPKA